MGCSLFSLVQDNVRSHMYIIPLCVRSFDIFSNGPVHLLGDSDSEVLSFVWQPSIQWWGWESLHALWCQEFLPSWCPHGLPESFFCPCLILQPSEKFHKQHDVPLLPQSAGVCLCYSELKPWLVHAGYNLILKSLHLSRHISSPLLGIDNLYSIRVLTCLRAHS